MKLAVSNLDTLSSTARDAAVAAGEMIVSRIGSVLEIQKKNSGSSEASQVVTEVDIASQDIILDYLQPTLDQFDLALLTEESPDDGSRFEKDYFWSVDPLDGTLPFVEGIPGYAVSIALVSRAGIPVIGVVYDPVQEALYSAVSGQGVYKNGEPLVVSIETGLMSIALRQAQERWSRNERHNSEWRHFDHAQCAPGSTSKTVLSWIMDRSLLKHTRFAEFKDRLTRFAEKQGSTLEILDRGGAVMNAIRSLEHTPRDLFQATSGRARGRQPLGFCCDLLDRSGSGRSGW